MKHAAVMLSVRLMCFAFLFGCLFLPSRIIAQTGNHSAPAEEPKPTPTSGVSANYPLGPGDQVSIWALGAEEMSDRPVRVDPSGYLNLPLIGRVRAGGLTAAQLQKELEVALRSQVKNPEVVVNVTEVRSQPVSVLGALNKPGIYQLQGNKTLAELLSMAGGPRTEAGNVINIQRRVEYGPLPVRGAHPDPTGKFSIGAVSLQSVMDGRSGSIYLAPEDVVTVPASPLVYVIGEVRKPGGFVIGERDKVSVLQALSMAEGLDKFAVASKARLLRVSTGEQRDSIPVDLKGILAGKQPDVTMQPDDILVVPNSKARNGLAKIGEVAANAVTGVAIYRVGLGF